jgi:RNA polymerase sigma factor (sigma-70 family)
MAWVVRCSPRPGATFQSFQRFECNRLGSPSEILPTLAICCNELRSRCVRGEMGLALGSSRDDRWSGLMRLAIAGDQSAYKTLLEEIAPYVRAVALRIASPTTAGVSDVEDVVQETLLAIHLKRGTWQPSLPFTPWLNAIIRHKAIDAMRRRGTRVEIDIDTLAEGLAAPSRSDDASLDVATMLATLDERQRTIVKQLSLEGRGAADVARELGMTESAVRVVLHRALKTLAERFGGRAI